MADPRTLLKPAVLRARAYSVPEARGLIKLDAMENPWPWPDELREQWAEQLRDVAVNRYPDASPRALDLAARGLMAIPDSLAALYGNGSDELIQLLLLGLDPEAGGVLVPEPSFVLYRSIAEYIGLPCRSVPLGEGFALDEAALAAAVARHRPGIIFIASPNNPTGVHYPESALRAIIEGAPGLVVIDEAYFPYSGRSLIGLAQEYEQVLVLRTVSKFGLAGLRVGALAGAPDWIREFEKLRLPYNISALSQAGLCFAARHRQVLDRQVAELCRQRDRLHAALEELAGLTVWSSRANFLMFRPSRWAAPALHDRLLRAGILIKDLHGSHAQLENCLRVTVGTAEENTAFLEALRRILTDDG